MEKILKFLFWIALAIVGFVVGWSLKAWSVGRSTKKGV